MLNPTSLITLTLPINLYPYIQTSIYFPIPIFTLLYISIIFIVWKSAKAISKSDILLNKRLILAFALLYTFTPLLIFKYLNFFSSILSQLLARVNIHTSVLSKTISLSSSLILPLGISFITFQIAGYLLDVYRKKISYCKNFYDLTLFIFYFPQLIAGPIMRFDSLIDQLKNGIIFFQKDNIKEGHFYFFRGLVKKVVLADFAALTVDSVYYNLPSHSFMYVFAATMLYSFQIYLDFSGYSDMAIGLSRYLGIKLTTNFKFPYLASNPSEFWRRWHISLSTWFRDYIYIPIGGSKASFMNYIAATLVTFVLSAIWHGAGMGFIYCGFFHALLLISHRFLKGHFIKLPHILSVFTNFILMSLGWMFFRSGREVAQIFEISRLLPSSEIEIQRIFNIASLITIFYFLHWLEARITFEKISHLKKRFLHICYAFSLLLCYLFSGDVQNFIYFQF
jgi:D-alanyl-lipoteichoic acid acyltransferase DltB (MBOAT superfamily)